MCDPACRRLALEVVREPLELTTMVIDLTLRPRYTMVLVVVDQKDDFLSETTPEIVELHRLPVVHVPVRVTLLEQEWRLKRVDGEHGRVANVCLRVLPQRDLHALLPRLVVPGLRLSGVERRVPVHADEISERRAGDRRREHAVSMHRI